MSQPFIIANPQPPQLTDYQVLDYARTGWDFWLAHLPGAQKIAKTLVWRPVDGVAGMLPSAQVLQPELSQLGLDPTRPVLVYDAGNGLYAARLAWALVSLGFATVHLLEGGLTAWQRAGYPTAFGPSHRRPARPIQLQPSSAWLANFADVERRPPDTVLLDTRSRGEFLGFDRRSARGGRIPGAVHWDWQRALAADGRSFRSPAELRADLAQLGVGPHSRVITYCQSGVRASHALYALYRAGLTQVKVYDGSWEEWGNRADTSIVTGEPRPAAPTEPEVAHV